MVTDALKVDSEGGSAFFRGSFRLLVATAEFLNATRGIDKLTLAGVKRVIRGVHVGVVAVAAHRGARDELGAVGQLDRHKVVIGVDVFFHCEYVLLPWLVRVQDGKYNAARHYPIVDF